MDDELDKTLYKEFMGEATGEEEQEEQQEEIIQEEPEDKKELKFFEFVHDDDGNVTMNAETFEKLISKIL